MQREDWKAWTKQPWLVSMHFEVTWWEDFTVLTLVTWSCAHTGWHWHHTDSQQNRRTPSCLFRNMTFGLAGGQGEEGTISVSQTPVVYFVYIVTPWWWLRVLVLGPVCWCSSPLWKGDSDTCICHAYFFMHCVLILNTCRCYWNGQHCP